MSPTAKSAVAKGSGNTSGEHQTAVQTACLLCQVVWPRILRHRHLILDSLSEAKTLYKQMQLSIKSSDGLTPT